MRVTSRFCSAASRLNGGGVNCLVAMYRPNSEWLAAQLIVELADKLRVVGRARQADTEQGRTDRPSSGACS